MKKRSTPTQQALNILKQKKMGAFSWAIVLVFAGTFCALIWTFLGACFHKMEWARFLEFNGVMLATVGAGWTTLGVRMSEAERDALLALKGNPSQLASEIVHALRAASNFATLGAIFLLVGGTFLAIKAYFY